MGNRYSGRSYTRDILTEIYQLSRMKSLRKELIDRMKTGWGRFVLASLHTLPTPLHTVPFSSSHPPCPSLLYTLHNSFQISFFLSLFISVS